MSDLTLLSLFLLNAELLMVLEQVYYILFQIFPLSFSFIKKIRKARQGLMNDIYSDLNSIDFFKCVLQMTLHPLFQILLELRS